MIPKSYPILNFKVKSFDWKSKKVPNPELSFALADSKTPQEIYRSPTSIVSQLSNLPPVQIDPGLFRSLSLIIYQKTPKGEEILGSASFELGKKFPAAKTLKYQKILDAKIEITKGEMQLPEFAKERPDINTAEVAVLEDELRKGLTEYDFKSPDEIEEAIETTRRSITFNRKKKNLSIAKLEEDKLADLEWLRSSRNKLRSNPLLAINPIEIATQKKIDVIDGLMDDIKNMPICVERFLTSILCYAYYKTYNFDPELYIHRKIEIINPEKEFSNYIEFLIKKGEEDVPENFRKYYESQEWGSLIRETEKILKDYRPVNIKEMDRLIKKSTKNSRDLENKDIILLIGATGSGKSTTTHFLCGSTMETRTEEGISDIKATSIKNSALKQTIISSHAQSETRYITHIPLNIPDSDRIIFLCDTPGLMDTSGPEVDMANTISIVEYVKKCRSVRPLILLSSKTEGDRFEGVQKLAQTLGRLITDFNKYSLSFTYAFTKYKKADAANIHGKVKLILKNQENADTAFFHILKDIRDKTIDGALTIHPIKDNYQELLRKIMERDPILDPQYAFERFITEDSRVLLKHQVEISTKEIEAALNSLDYDMIRYRLDELAYIDALFTEINSKYAECVESIIRATKDTYHKTILQFNSFLDNNGTLDENTIKHYKEIYKALKISDKIREKHLREETPPSKGMLENLVNRLSLTQSEFKLDEVDDYILSTQLKNGKILGESFEDLAPLYKSLCDKYVNFIENLLSSGSTDLKNTNFVDFSNNLSEAERHLVIAREHLGYANLDEKLNLLKNQFISSLKERFNNSIAPLKKGSLGKSDIEALKINISIIKSASDVHSLRELINKNEIGNLLLQIKEDYQSYFEKSKEHVLSIINSKTTRNISEIEANFDEFVLLMEVPDIEYLIAASYQDTLNSLINKINFYKGEAKDIIKSFSNSPESVDFAPLRDCFACLESGKWIEKLREGIYSNELSGVEKEIKIFIDKLLTELKEIDLGYEHPYNVPKGYSIVQKMREVVQLKEFIPSVENCDKIIIGIFEKRADESLKFIKRELNPELRDSERDIKELEKLREIKLKYSQDEEAKVSAEKLEIIVRNNGFESIEEVDKKIKEIENFIQKFNKRLEEGSIDIDKIENSYQYIEECKNIPELLESTQAISKSILENLIQFYNKNLGSLSEYFNSVPRKIQDERFTAIESIKTFSHQTALRFKEISLLSTKSPSFSKYFDMQPYFIRYCTKLDELGDILSEKLRLSDENSQFQKMSSLLVIVTEFAIVNDNFKSLSAKYEKILSTKLSQTCKSILDSIEIHSFDRVNQLIKCLNQETWNENKDIVKDRSQFMVELILTDTKEMTLNINNSKLDHPLIAKILKNIQKIRLAKQNEIYDLFDQPKKDALIELERETTNIFENKIMEFLNSINVAIQSFKFREAEEKIKDIQDLNTELNGEIYPLKIEEVKNEINNLRLKLINGIKNSTIKDFKDFPQILEIEEAANSHPVYKETLNAIIGFINGKLQTAKNAFPQMLYPEKKAVIDDINSILGILPKEIKESTETLIKDLKKSIKTQKKEIRNKIDILAKEENINELCNILRELNSQQSQSDSQHAEGKLREILTSIKSELNSALFKKDWNIVFNKALILTSKDDLKDLIKESETTISEIYQSLDQLIERNLSTLLNIDSKNGSEELIEAFRVYEAFMDFKTKASKNSKTSDIFDVNNTIIKMLTGISNFYAKLNSGYIKELSDSSNLYACNTILKKIKERDDFLKIFKEFLLQHQDEGIYANCQQILKIQPYSKYVETLSEIVYKLSEYFKNLKIEFSEIKHPAILERISNEIQEKWNQLNRFEEIKNHLDPDVIDFDKAKSAAFESVSNEIDKIVKKAVSLIEKENIQKEDFNKLFIMFIH